MAGNENKDNVHRANAEWLTREICSEYEKERVHFQGIMQPMLVHGENSA